MEDRLGPTGRYVDPVFQHGRRPYVGFIRDLAKADSVKFVEAAVEHVGFFFIAKRVGAHGVYRRCTCQQPAFFEPSVWTVAHKESGYVVPPMSRTRFIRCAFFGGCKRI